jgi:hypothetical protein
MTVLSHDGQVYRSAHGRAVNIRDQEDSMDDQAADTPVLDLLETMTTASLDATSLDAQSLVLVRVAALVAVDAPPIAYLLNFGAGREVGLGLEDARGVLAAIAPIVGTARTVSALGNIARALGLALDAIELDAMLGDED